MNTPVSFEIAKLLKEKGFEQKERPSYLLIPFRECTALDTFGHDCDKLGFGDIIGYYIPDKTVNAPAIAEVVMWLYDKYNYSIEHSMNIPQSGEQDGCYVFNGIVKGVENYKLVIHYSSENLSSVKKAYEVAIEHALKNLM